MTFRSAFPRLLCSTIALLLLTAELHAADSIWRHNGSQMLLQADGSSRVITYWKPRGGISARRGTVLFRGRRVGNRYEGTAFTFRRGCAPAPYRVSGQLPSETRIVVRGAAPRRVKGGCKVIGYSWDSPNSRLVFTYVRKVGNTQPEPQPQPQPEEPIQDQPSTRLIARDIPGGQVVFKVTDLGEPVSLPITIDVSVQCHSGVSQTILRDHRVCQLDDVTLAGDNQAVIMHERHYSGEVCDIIQKTRLRYDGVCQ